MMVSLEGPFGGMIGKIRKSQLFRVGVRGGVGGRENMYVSSGTSKTEVTV